MKKDPQSVVFEAGEATPGTLDLLDAQVETLGRAVGRPGAVVVQDLGPPALECLSERADLFDLVALASDDGLVEEHSGFLEVIGQVDVADGLLSASHAEHLVVGIAEAQPGQHLVPAPLVETLVASEQELADAKRGSSLRPRCPSVSFWTRRRTWSRVRLATRVTWKGSATRRAWLRCGCSPTR
jgi:hypothetical protein